MHHILDGFNKYKIWGKLRLNFWMMKTMEKVWNVLLWMLVGGGGKHVGAVCHFFTKRLKHRSFLLLLRRPPGGRLRPRGKTRLPSACSETHRGAETKLRQIVGHFLSVRLYRSSSVSHRQIIDSIWKRSDLSHRPFRVFHLPGNKQPDKQETDKSEPN